MNIDGGSPARVSPKGPFRVLAIASGGGHWVQLLRMRPAWEGCDVAYATTNADYRRDVRQAGSDFMARFYTIPDANINQRLRLVRQLASVASIILRERPDVVISTGASAGYFALRIAKHFGCKTIWVDSIANVEKLSLAGRNVERFADLWLTQWPELAHSPSQGEPAPQYFGAVL
jgi:UDP-N-acetylglucosamine:LPS N-acetylglucosamine transferase